MKAVGRSSRRNFLAGLGATALAAWPARALGRIAGSALSASASKNIYDELGVNTIINGWGTITLIGGLLIPPEAVAAMDVASRHFVSIPDLLKTTEDEIAAMLKGLPADHAVTVTSGAVRIAQGLRACARNFGRALRLLGLVLRWRAGISPRSIRDRAPVCAKASAQTPPESRPPSRPSPEGSLWSAPASAFPPFTAPSTDFDVIVCLFSAF